MNYDFSPNPNGETGGILVIMSYNFRGTVGSGLIISLLVQDMLSYSSVFIIVSTIAKMNRENIFSS